MARTDEKEASSGAWDVRNSVEMDTPNAGLDIDETEFEDLATFRLKPEAIEGETQAFLARYAAYLRRQGLNFD